MFTKMRVKDFMLHTKQEIKTLTSHAMQIFTPKALFKHEMEDINYELSPCLHFFVMELLCYYDVVIGIFYWALCVNVCLCSAEIFLIISKKIVLAKHAFILCFQILGIASGNIILPTRKQLIITERLYRQIQWPLNIFKPKQRAYIGKLGLYQSLAFEMILILSAFDFYIMFPEINKTAVMTAAFEYNNSFVTGLLYFLEIGDVLTMCYFVLMVPCLHIFFATKAEAQIFLLTQYVNSLNHYLTVNKKKNPDKIVRYNLKLIHGRYCEIQQVYLDIKNAVSSAGIKYVLPSSMITIFIVYAAVEGDLSIVILAMHFIVFSIVLIFTMISGQRYEDEWKYFYESLCKLPWYTWNLRNQKSYLTIITGSSKFIQLIILETIVVNYSLFIKVGKFLYTGANMVFSTYGK